MKYGLSFFHSTVQEVSPQSSIFCSSSAKRPIQQNLITISFCLLSSKPIKELKQSFTNVSTLLEWLKAKYVYIKADTLGSKQI